MKTNAELDSLNLSALADRLAQVWDTRTEHGWGTDNAVTKSSLERRIFERVCKAAQDDASRVSCDVEVALEVERRIIESEKAELRSGGLLIPCKAGSVRDGARALLKIRTENNYPLKVKCVVHRSQGEDGIGVAFEDLEGAEQRRVERLIRELLRHQTV